MYPIVGLSFMRSSARRDSSIDVYLRGGRRGQRLFVYLISGRPVLEEADVCNSTEEMLLLLQHSSRATSLTRFCIAFTRGVSFT